MGFYANRILPHLIHFSMRQESFTPYRRRVVSGTSGRVLEIGVGSGLNFPLYPEAVTRLVGLDPSLPLLTRARAAAGVSHGRVELLSGSAEAIPLEDSSVDSVVMSWTLCSIPDASHALHELRRVLTASGTLHFVEHGRSPDAGVARWQDRLTPWWKRIGGGCHLNRPIGELIEGSGFRLERLDTGYMTGPKMMTFMYEGVGRRI